MGTMYQFEKVSATDAGLIFIGASVAYCVEK
jgi:hypothetical protein